LLVVISIMSVLMAIMLPAIGGARQNSKTVSCSANLRSMALSAQVYKEEFQGWLPRDAFSSYNAFFLPLLISSPAPDITQVTVGPYTGPRVQVDKEYCLEWMRQVKVARCPSVTNPDFVLSYVVNSCDRQVYLDSGILKATPWQKIRANSAPSRVAYLLEANTDLLSPTALGQFKIYKYDDLPYYFSPNPQAGLPTPRPAAVSASERRHGGSAGVAYLDGSVESKSLKDPRAWPSSLMTSVVR